MDSKPIKITLKCKWVKDYFNPRKIVYLYAEGRSIATIAYCTCVWRANIDRSDKYHHFDTLDEAKAWVVKRIKELNK